jgi:hypothetical protein
VIVGCRTLCISLFWCLFWLPSDRYDRWDRPNHNTFHYTLYIFEGKKAGGILHTGLFPGPVTILVDPWGIVGVRLISYPDTYFHYLRPCPRLAIEPCWICLSRLGYLPWSNDIARYQTSHPGGCHSLTCTPYKPRKAHQKRSQIQRKSSVPPLGLGHLFFLLDCCTPVFLTHISWRPSPLSFSPAV